MASLLPKLWKKAPLVSPASRQTSSTVVAANPWRRTRWIAAWRSLDRDSGGGAFLALVFILPYIYQLVGMVSSGRASGLVSATVLRVVATDEPRLSLQEEDRAFNVARWRPRACGQRYSARFPSCGKVGAF